MAKDMKECPFCGVDVKKSNFDKHVRKVHADLSAKELKAEGLSKPAKSARKEQREEQKKAEARKQEKKREMRFVAVGIILIVMISVVGVFVYENLTGGQSGNGTTKNGGGGGNPVAVMVTSMGTIKIELYEDDAPITAGNFISLAEDGFFDGLIFHRVVPGFVVQGGGHLPDGSQKTASNIPWEDTGHTNKRYTVAMARSGDANDLASSGTATSQFFINLADNAQLDGYTYPYVVFGKVTEGQDVVDAIAALPTGNTGKGAEWPDNPPVISSVTIER